jgi:hypothetical protein
MSATGSRDTEGPDQVYRSARNAVPLVKYHNEEQKCDGPFLNRPIFMD